MKKTKKDSVQTHFNIRCMQRLGYIPREDDLIKAIQNNKLEFLKKQSNRVTRWLWVDPVTNIECILPYDKGRKQIITILFKEDRNEESNSKNS